MTAIRYCLMDTNLTIPFKGPDKKVMSGYPSVWRKVCFLSTMKLRLLFSLVLYFILSLLLNSCSPPRSVINSGKVLPKKQVRFGNNYSFNVSSSPISQTIKGVYSLGQDISNKDTVYFNEQINSLNSAILAYALDPIGYNTDLYLRVGLGHRMDIGYRNSGSAHAFDMMYQFLGSNETYKNSSIGGMYGSAGLQYSYENFKFLDSKFDKLTKVLDMKMTRKDFSIPVIFSKSFGPEERSGCFGFGVVYTHSFINYRIAPKNIYLQNNEGVKELLAPVNGKANYGSYGTFVNIKVGRRFIFFNASLAAYYQNYGTYALLGGGMVKLKGVTIVPAYGLQFNIIPRKKKVPPAEGSVN
ncbi:MAG: hypothetical protein M3R27_08225 [Bacteroidota bacterium]|nr:hypothetical protein [Bacteroidota bacterium]